MSLAVGACVGVQCGANPLRQRQQRGVAGAAARRCLRRAVRAQAQNEPSPWDTLSMDELQEWEVRRGGRPHARRLPQCTGAPPPAPSADLARKCAAGPPAVACMGLQRHRGRPPLTGWPACSRPPPLPQETGPPTPLLDTINYPVHLKNLGPNDLKKLCKELRAGAPRAR